jgi:hypothetical protein
LEGNGTINVNLTVNTGAVVAPGTGTNIGTLTVPGASQFQGQTVMKLNAAAGSSDQINASSFIYGGTLTVTNVTGAFAAGQTFQLFLGSSYSGTFNTVNLPVLGAGLTWNNSLAANGTLQVVTTAKPQITGIKLSGQNLILNGTDGPAGGQYELLSSTNLALPLNQWVPVTTNNFDNSGNFNATNAVSPGTPQIFYILQIP